jgi:hypothetical protein
MVYNLPKVRRVDVDAIILKEELDGVRSGMTGSDSYYATPYQPTSAMASNSSLKTGVSVVTQLVSCNAKSA